MKILRYLMLIQVKKSCVSLALGAFTQLKWETAEKKGNQEILSSGHRVHRNVELKTDFLVEWREKHDCWDDFQLSGNRSLSEHAFIVYDFEVHSWLNLI